MLPATAYVDKQNNYFNSSKNFLVIGSNPWHFYQNKINHEQNRKLHHCMGYEWIPGSLRSKIYWLPAHKIIQKKTDNQVFHVANVLYYDCEKELFLNNSSLSSTFDIKVEIIAWFTSW